MLHCSKRITALLFTVVFACVFCSAPGFAQESTATPETNSDSMAADIALARPVGTVATVAGFALFLVSAPFSALGGNTKEAWETLVVPPASYTFKRPLGHFEGENAQDRQTTTPETPVKRP